MKTIRLTIILLTLTTLATAQNFEGRVLYKNTYVSKHPSLSTAQLNSMMGTFQEYLIKKGDYKSTLNGSFFQWQLYRSAENRLYNKMSNSEAILYNEGASNPDQVIKAELNQKVTRILGYECDELILTCKSGIQKYYFNSSTLGVDPKLFENHKYGNWSEVLSRTKSLPLKIVIDNPQFSLESTVTEITPMQIEASLFQLPDGAKIEKNPY